MMSLSMKKCSIFLKNNKNNTFGSQIKRNFMVTRPSHNLGLQFKFHKASSRNFGSISILSRYVSRKFTKFIELLIIRGFLVSKLSKIIGTRAGIYRLLLVGLYFLKIIVKKFIIIYCVACLVHVIATISGSLLIDRQIMMSITDYVNNLTIKEDQTFQIVKTL